MEPVNREEARQEVSRSRTSQPTIQTEHRRGSDQTDPLKSTRSTTTPGQRHERIESAPTSPPDAVVPREPSKETPANSKTDQKKTDSTSKQQRQLWEKITDQQKKSDTHQDVTKTPSTTKSEQSIQKSKPSTAKKPPDTKDASPQKRTSDSSKKSDTPEKRSRKQ
jgi:hypothetical protein